MGAFELVVFGGAFSVVLVVALVRVDVSTFGATGSMATVLLTGGVVVVLDVELTVELLVTGGWYTELEVVEFSGAVELVGVDLSPWFAAMPMNNTATTAPPVIHADLRIFAFPADLVWVLSGPLGRLAGPVLTYVGRLLVGV
ncbi:hypothetical protein GCM10029964_023960 [Kibdelosporangium lantanae]